MDSLLGSGTRVAELKEQAIFFPDPLSLNDPMEGHRNVFWQGDEVVWKCLFRNYLLCLERYAYRFMLQDETLENSAEGIYTELGTDDYMSDYHRELSQTVQERFFNNASMQKIIRGLSQRTSQVQKNELMYWLEIIHPFAREELWKEMIARRLVNPGFTPTNSAEVLEKLVEADFLSVTNQLEKDQSESSPRDFEFFWMSNHFQEKRLLLRRFNGEDDGMDANNYFISYLFPQAYPDALERLAYPPWGAACFYRSPPTASLWAAYADEHKGVCLIFDPNLSGEKPSLKIKSQALQFNQTLPLDEVTYSGEYKALDFFRRIGQLPMHKLHQTWYSADGSTSPIFEEIRGNEEEWRRKYWSDFSPALTSKSKDWQHEVEHRIILTSFLSQLATPEERTALYDFTSLHGIIFGINTSMEHKIEVMKIVDQKCREHGRSIEFYQARYSPEGKTVVSPKLLTLPTDHKA